MLFNEPAFLFLFLPVTLACYYAARGWGRNLVLLAASLFYYCWGESRFIPFLILSILLNFYLAIYIDRYRDDVRGKLFLAIGIFSDLALLVVFKYTGFLLANFNTLLSAVHAGPVHVKTILLPLGISFFTFHKISYKVDVYRNVAEARRNALDLALYILLFPQLIAGPIVRYHEIANDLTVRHETMAKFVYGVERFVGGLGKKVLIANNVALVADRVFGHAPGDMTASVAWLGALCYSIQLYFDFSGYSDMALGLASMFGFSFPENFNYPYRATSITDFWHRWHMTLSRWFRDYLYIPLGGNRAGLYRNLFIVFFLCGLWHGASWNFVVWGLFHGAFLVLERTGWGQNLRRWPAALQHFYALLVVMVGWVFFRSESLPHAFHYLGTMFGYAAPTVALHDAASLLDRQTLTALVAGLVFSVPMPRLLNVFFRPAGWAPDLPTLLPSGIATLRFASMALVLYGSCLFMAAGSYSPFIYFRF